MPELSTVRAVLEHYDLANAEVGRLGAGLINDTFLISAKDGERYVLQRLNKVFAPQINLDIDVLTQHLQAQGAATLQLVPPRHGGAGLWVESAGRCWRLATYVPGDCFERLGDAAAAREAGALLGRFHRLASSLDIELHAPRLGVHDTARHLQGLHDALAKHSGHRNFRVVERLAAAVFAVADALPPLPQLPVRLVHGDPKISNLIFDPRSGAGICMIDLDTIAHMPLPLELGDAFRSWCNPRGEDARRAVFRLDFFAAALQGYAAETAGFIQPQEWQNLVPATRTIMVELAARFTADALNESYFGWDREAFADSSAHNQVRAAGQLELHHAFCAQLGEVEAIVAETFGA